MKEKLSFRKTMLIFVLIIIIANLLLTLSSNKKALDYQQLVILEKNKVLNNHQSAMSEKEKEIALLDEKIKNLEDSVDESNKMLEEKYRNYYYQMFYGRWQKTNNIYVEKHPMREIFYETEEEIEEAKKKADENFSYDLIYLDKNAVTFKSDTEEIRLNPIYRLYTFPYRGDFKPGICWGAMLTLDDLGLNKNEYVTYSTLRYYPLNEEDKDILGNSELNYTNYNKFYIKDMNTIIFSDDFCYVEYKRVSSENVQDFDIDYYPA